MREHDLDPDDWDAFEEQVGRITSDLVALLRDVEERPVWQRPPEETLRHFSSPPPAEGADLDALWQELREHVVPYLSGNLHPRFFGWAHGGGAAAGAVGELIAGFLNANLAGRNQAPVVLERQVVGWFSELFGFPEGSSGTLVSGTSVGNLVGLAVARDQALDSPGTGPPRAEPRLYVSECSHLSVSRAAHLIGFPEGAVVQIGSDSDQRLDPERLQEAIAEDRAAGRQPVAVVATAGTSGTGAIDPLPEVTDVCRRHDLWLHVDGAFGAVAYLSNDPPPSLGSLPEADSLAFDFHKWMSVPYSAGCVLVRDREAHLETFETSAPYTDVATGELGGRRPWPTSLGPEMSRGFRGLKVWLTVRHYGLDRLVAQIDQARSQAARFADWVRDRTELRLAAPVSLNVVCLRYVGGGDLPSAGSDRLQERIIETLQRRGVAAPSAAVVEGETCVRAAVFNHRTTMDDLEAFGTSVIEAGRELAPGVAGPAASPG